MTSKLCEYASHEDDAELLRRISNSSSSPAPGLIRGGPAGGGQQHRQLITDPGTRIRCRLLSGDQPSNDVIGKNEKARSGAIQAGFFVPGRKLLCAPAGQLLRILFSLPRASKYRGAVISSRSGSSGSRLGEHG